MVLKIEGSIDGFIPGWIWTGVHGFECIILMDFYDNTFDRH